MTRFWFCAVMGFVCFWGESARAVPLVTVSVEPLALIAREICSVDCEIVTLVPRGASEHGWQPGPKDVARVKGSIASVGVGLGFDEPWLKKLAISPNSILWLGESLSPMGWWSDDMTGGEKQAGHEDHDHHHETKVGSNDPHVWTDAGRMAKAAELMAGHLAIAIPASAELFKSRGRAIAGRLTALQLDVDRRRKTWRTRPVVMFHDVAGYFARRFDLPVLSISSGGSGHDLSARVIANVSKRFGKAKVAAIMVERDDGAAKSLARELKTVVRVVDFAASKPYKTWDDWYSQMVNAWDEVLR